MIKERTIERVVVSAHRSTIDLEHSRSDLMAALTLILEELARGADGPVGQVSRLVRPADHWEDESHRYFEVKLPDRSVSGIDISVSDGRAFIRLER